VGGGGESVSNKTNAAHNSGSKGIGKPVREMKARETIRTDQERGLSRTVEKRRTIGGKGRKLIRGRKRTSCLHNLTLFKP